MRKPRRLNDLQTALRHVKTPAFEKTSSDHSALPASSRSISSNIRATQCQTLLRCCSHACLTVSTHPSALEGRPTLICRCNFLVFACCKRRCGSEAFVGCMGGVGWTAISREQLVMDPWTAAAVLTLGIPTTDLQDADSCWPLGRPDLPPVVYGDMSARWNRGWKP